MPDVLVDRVGPVGVVTLNRPDRLNAIVPGMLESYAAALSELDADPDVRAIVVTGAGRGFCSGADLAILEQGPDALAAYADGMDADRLPTLALRIGTPVVAAVNGPCAGIGMVLAMCSDIRIAGPAATFTTAFSRLGLVAEYGIAWLLPRLIGLGPATELLLSSRTVDAGEALALGMVGAIEDDPLEAAMAWAATAAARVSPHSARVMKAQLLAAAEQDLGAAVADAIGAMRASFAGPDFAEAVAARADGRAPRFGGQGR